MNYSKRHIKPDSFFENRTFDEHCSAIPAFYFKKEVPIDVLGSFEVVEKLLVFSYYEYKFIDEAYIKAIRTFEMAMSIRHKDFYPSVRKLNFNELIHNLSELDLFETSLESLKNLKWQRNYYLRPEHHSFAGVVLWNRIEQLNWLVNEMYEDVPLRLERRQLVQEMRDAMRNLNLNENSVIQLNGERTILYRLRLLFVNNKTASPTYLFVCTPLFDLETENGSVKIPAMCSAKVVNVFFQGNTLIAVNGSTNQQVVISPIAEHKDLLGKLEGWRSSYESLPNKFHFESSLSCFIPDFLNPEIREFQKL